jgi:hypothetical protein
MRFSRARVPVPLQEWVYIRACVSKMTPCSLQIYDRLLNNKTDFIVEAQFQRPYLILKSLLKLTQTPTALQPLPAPWVRVQYAVSTDTSIVPITPCRLLISVWKGTWINEKTYYNQTETIYVQRKIPCLKKLQLWKWLSSHRPDDGGSKHLWNIGKLLPDYTAQQPTKRPSSYSPPWESQISRTLTLFLEFICHKWARINLGPRQVL